MVFAAILGGGKGLRMGSTLPKQFLEIDGEAIIIKSLRVFAESGLLDAILLAVPESYIAYTRRLIERSGLLTETLPIHVISGGESRSQSLKKTLEFFRETYGLEGNIILTHDAVRPYIDKRIIEENIAAAMKYGAANTCVPATDTVFLSEDGRFMGEVPPRKTVFHCQTPQSFKADLLWELINKLPAGEFDALTDGCSVFTRFHLPVSMVEGSPENVKITYPKDLI